MVDYLFSLDDDPTRLMIYLIAAGLVGYLLAIAWWWRARRRRNLSRYWHARSFVRAILRTVEFGTLGNLEQALDLYRAHFQLDSIDARERHRLSQLVREAILELSTDGQRPRKALDQLDLLRMILRENDKVLESEDLALPFSGTPNPERRLLEDVLELTRSDRSIVQSKLTQLADLIVARHETVGRLSEESSQSLWYAKLGLVGTVVFSLLSIALTIWAI